jgi:hypothetical protein
MHTLFLEQFFILQVFDRPTSSTPLPVPVPCTGITFYYVRPRLPLSSERAPALSAALHWLRRTWHPHGQHALSLSASLPLGASGLSHTQRAGRAMQRKARQAEHVHALAQGFKSWRSEFAGQCAAQRQEMAVMRQLLQDESVEARKQFLGVQTELQRQLEDLISSNLAAFPALVPHGGTGSSRLGLGSPRPHDVGVERTGGAADASRPDVGPWVAHGARVNRQPQSTPPPLPAEPCPPPAVPRPPSSAGHSSSSWGSSSCDYDSRQSQGDMVGLGAQSATRATWSSR